MPKLRQDKAWLLATARAVAVELNRRSEGTKLRIRIPSRATTTKTDGWAAAIGRLGKKLRLEIWLDQFSGYPDRKLYACLHTNVRTNMTAVTDRVSRKLWPARTVKPDDLIVEKKTILAKRLRRSEFSRPIIEKYDYGQTFYGIYDPTRSVASRLNTHFCSRAVAFFEDVARALPSATATDEEREVYPQIENRKRVAAHLQRERSRFLAAQCKIRDDYRCQVCGFRFEKTYGDLGNDFAEAHHRIPLGQLRGETRTKLEELITVCANCHRMLHRMAGRKDDASKLKQTVKMRRRKRLA